MCPRLHAIPPLQPREHRVCAWFQVQPGPCRSLPVGARARLVSVFPSGPFLMLFGKCIPFHSPAPSLLISRPPFFLIFTFSWTPRTLLYIFFNDLSHPGRQCEAECLFSRPSFYLKFNSVSPLLPSVSCGQLLKEAMAAESSLGDLIEPFFEKRMTGR